MSRYSPEQLTEWREGNPPCPGLWQRDFHKTKRVILAYFDGDFWFQGVESDDAAKAIENYKDNLGSLVLNRRWRGLNFNPDA